VKVAAAQLLAVLQKVPGRAGGLVAGIDRDLDLADSVVAVMADFALNRRSSRGCCPVVSVRSGLKNYNLADYDILDRSQPVGLWQAKYWHHHCLHFPYLLSWKQ
jgi:hypothetical protein